MPRAVLPSKKSLKQDGNCETEFCYTTRADVHHLVENNMPSPKSTPTMIRVNGLRPCTGRTHLNPSALPHYFGTCIKLEDAQLVHMQEVAGLHGGVITSTIVAFASV